MARVLVVEDELLVREFITDELEDAGFDVESSHDGDNALELLKSGEGFDLLFTDVRMPGLLDGWELGRIAADLVPGILIVYATGYSDQPRALRTHERFLAKPYRTSDILNVIDGLGIRR